MLVAMSVVHWSDMLAETWVVSLVADLAVHWAVHWACSRAEWKVVKMADQWADSRAHS